VNPEVHVRPTAFMISVWPEGGETVNTGSFSIMVEFRGHGRWAVLHGGMCLETDGKWDFERSPSNRDDEWLATHRFTFDEALALAREHAPKISLMGKTALEVLAGEQSGAIYSG
jgi:hypothetical protein